MKVFIPIIWTLLASIAIISCNKELIDFEDSNYPTNYNSISHHVILSNLKLSSMTINDKPFDTSMNLYRYSFEYDSKGRLIKTNLYSNSDYKIFYSDDSIIINSTNINEDPQVAYLDSNKIVRMSTWNTIFKYDSLNRLITKCNQYDTLVYSYSDSNMVKRVEIFSDPPIQSNSTTYYEYYDSLEIRDHQFFFRPYFNSVRFNAGQIFSFQYLDYLGLLNNKLLKNLRLTYDNGYEERYHYIWEITGNRITGLKIYSDTSFISQYKYYY